MTSPVVESVTTTTESFPNDTTCTTNMPGTVSSGDLLVWVAAIGDGASASSWGGSFTELLDVQNSNIGLAVAYKESSGSESSTYDLTLSADEYAACAVFRVSGAESPGTQAPESGTATGNSSSADPPSKSATGGSDDYLAIAAAAQQAANAISSYPGGYSNTGSLQTGQSGALEALHYGAKAFTAASENPDAFSLTASRNWVAGTIIIHPAAAGGGGGAIPITHFMQRPTVRHMLTR